MNRIYLDNCATTPLAPEVAAAMADAMSRSYGNPSSIHHEGRTAARILADARLTVAESIGGRPAEIVFTGSGTEANNLAIGGVISRAIRTSGHARVITSTMEHPSVRTRLAWERRVHAEKLEVIKIGVDEAGQIRLDELDNHLSNEVTLVALLLVNNETGAILNVDQLKKRKLAFPKVPWLLDVVQAHTKLHIDVRLWPFDMLSFAAHKIYGPKGIGALFVRGGTELDPLLVGGSQEKFRRAGTENIVGAVGFAAAVSMAPPPEQTLSVLHALEIAFIAELDAQGVKYCTNGCREAGNQRLPGTLNLSFAGADNREDLQIALDLEGVSLSSTSACHSGVSDESHVLAAMGIDGTRRSGAIRLQFSRYQEQSDAREAAAAIERVVARIRGAEAMA